MTNRTDYACSQAVTHPTTNTAKCCLTSEILRDQVYPTLHGPHVLDGVSLFPDKFLYFADMTNTSGLCLHYFFLVSIETTVG